MPRALPRKTQAAAVVFFAAWSSCAFMRPENRRALNYLDANLAPQSATARVVLSPVALPVGVAAGVADAVVVHPLTQADEAWRDTLDVLWDYDQSSSFRQVLLTPLSVLATPLVFAGDWCCRAVFDLGGAEVVDAETAEESGR
ncbi:MAG: hypothetical protein VXY92_12065 [Planctomycetota bacterium]|nr:hypothetical protein [Planctomycetota bacterium]